MILRRIGITVVAVALVVIATVTAISTHYFRLIVLHTAGWILIAATLVAVAGLVLWMIGPVLEETSKNGTPPLGPASRPRKT